MLSPTNICENHIRFILRLGSEKIILSYNDQKDCIVLISEFPHQGRKIREKKAAFTLWRKSEEKNPMALCFSRFLKMALVVFILGSCATTQKTISHKDELQEKMGLLAQEIASPIKKRIRVAVVEFTDIRGKSSELGMLLAVKLTGELYSTGKFDIVERERTQLDKIMEELRLSLSDLVDESSARRLGKQLAAEAILTGIIVDLGGSVDVNARLIDVETGTILATADAQIAKNQTIKELLPSYRRNLKLSMNIIAEREVGEGYEEVLVQEGGTLKSGDTFKVYFSTNEDCYTYIFIYDSQGRIQGLFPDPKTGLANRIRGTREYSVPPGGLWFELDENPGIETIYVLASYEPLKEIGKLFSQMARGGLERQINDFSGWGKEVHTFSQRGVSIRIPVIARGIKDVVQGKSMTYYLDDGTAVEKALEVMEGGDFVARAISFVHR